MPVLVSKPVIERVIKKRQIDMADVIARLDEGSHLIAPGLIANYQRDIRALRDLLAEATTAEQK